MHAILRYAVLLCLLAPLGCGDITGPRGELDAARRLWARRGLTSYDYTVEQMCYCDQVTVRPTVVTVLNGVVHSAYHLPDRSAVAPEHLQRFPTVESLFATVQRAIDRKADRLEVTYDRERGYPTLIDVDYSTGVADDEYRVRARNLQPVTVVQFGVTQIAAAGR